MKGNTTYPLKVLALLMTLVIGGCIEPFDVTFEDFESALVIEATITDEMVQQKVFLSRTYEFEAEGPTPESNATVQVQGGGTSYSFMESSPGVYISQQVFAAQPNTTYQLLIQTQDGRTYSSNEVVLPAKTQIDEVRAERITTDDGDDGIGIFVDSFDPSGSSENYRYTYEETYRVVAPFWTPRGLELVPPEEATVACEVRAIFDDSSLETGYASDFSNTIIQTSTTDLQEDRVSNFMVRFINRNNYIISHRYSILIKQFVQSNEAFTFYETLNEFSGNDSFFSETQPGFLEGNVSSDLSRNEKVLGFFDVASVVEQRIFFNYEDFYPGEDLPPFAIPCDVNAPELSRGVPPVCVLSVMVINDLVRFVDNNGATEGEGPFLVVPTLCGDLAGFAQPNPPDFWIED
ncbi:MULTISPECIES: DUF4249 domain-containing protein [Flavobacteriaceae]|uniref:DUF4249 domain-containing protein n=1 Tax=Flavobacteriaceae TaxID=49546 RepID=UPI001FEC4710|nr:MULTISPECIES: DUF4249 domain-containing protein [Allomuricauda]MDC6364839.1 DUF4249 domain-containing protein [Muricauda sp. AC10]